MPPKFDPEAITYIIIRQVGGEACSSAVLSQKVGPHGVAPKKVAEDLVKATQAWKGVKVTCQLKIQNRKVTIDVLPSATALIIRALKEPPRDRKKVKNIKHSGNLDFNTILDIAKTMRTETKGIPSRTLRGTVMEVLGTANAVGCTIDHKKPTEIQEMIRSGEIVISE